MTHAAIVDFGLGNLFSVRQACEHVGMTASITPDAEQVANADLVILPGVGAYKDAMDTLRNLGLVSVLRDYAESGRPLIGICLGMQLMMSVSHEFGTHEGLDLIQGEVLRFQPHDLPNDRRLKVPQVGWNTITPAQEDTSWPGTYLEGLEPDTHMYFVHSYYVVPQDESVTLSKTTYGNTEFCSSLQRGNVFACQFHPERSGREGLRMYANFARLAESVRS
jgi:glutamine amidotransferase